MLPTAVQALVLAVLVLTSASHAQETAALGQEELRRIDQRVHLPVPGQGAHEGEPLLNPAPA